VERHPLPRGERGSIEAAQISDRSQNALPDWEAIKHDVVHSAWSIARIAIARGVSTTRLEDTPRREAGRGTKRPSLPARTELLGGQASAGFFLEFGTSRSRASPWLVPALHARLPGINHAVRKVIAAALKAADKV
jgi:hypothetical protein